MKSVDFEEAKKLLDNLNARIDAAPSTAKPVFPGIVWLHDLVKSQEKKNDKARTS